MEKLQTNQTSAGTKPKFAFKRKGGSKKPAPDAPEVEPPISAETISRSPTSHLSLTSKSGCLLTFASLPDVPSIPIDSELIISNLDRCIVDMLESDSTTAPAAVHIANVADCILLLPVIKGSVLVHDIQRCVVVISGCHQVLCDPFSAPGSPSGHPPPYSLAPDLNPHLPSLGCMHQSASVYTCRPRLRR